MTSMTNACTSTHPAIAVASLLAAATLPTTTASATSFYSLPASSAGSSHFAVSQSSEPWRRFVAWGALRAKVISWGALAAGWDGEEGVAPAKETVQAALRFMEGARAAQLPLPQPYIAGDGEIGFRWAKGDAFASVAFLDDGELVAFIRDVQGLITEVQQPLMVAFPQKLFGILARFG